MSNTPQNESPRALALSTLLKIEENNSYANLSLDTALKHASLTPADRRLFTAIVYGVIERRITLDYLISAVSARKIDELDLKTRMLLRMGIFQLRFLDRIPPHAAVNESVALAGKRAGGFVNACLREYLRKNSTILLPDKSESLTRHLSVAHSVPEALCERFLSAFGADRTDSILRAFSVHPPLTLALNPLKVPDRDTWIASLKQEEIDATASPVTPNGVLLPAGAAIDAIPGFCEGFFFVQDEASQICVEALGAEAGETIIDACSCPGSKSFGSAIRMKNVGCVRSFDLHENKLSLVRSGANRLGITILTAEKKDGKQFDPALAESADRVLCDVPCSGYGVMGKKPDIRYKDPATADRLPEIQYAILENCARYVKPGGLLVYSTCTIFREENEDNVLKFLSLHPEFTPEDFSVGTVHSENGMLTLYPDTHGTDGFFVSRLRRRS